MRTIYKYELQVKDVQALMLPQGYEILSFQAQQQHSLFCNSRKGA